MNAALMLLLFRLGPTTTVTTPTLAVWPDGYKLFLWDNQQAKLLLHDEFPDQKLKQGVS